MKPLGSGLFLNFRPLTDGNVTPVQCLHFAMSQPTSVVITGCGHARDLDAGDRRRLPVELMSGTESRRCWRAPQRWPPRASGRSTRPRRRSTARPSIPGGWRRRPCGDDHLARALGDHQHPGAPRPPPLEPAGTRWSWRRWGSPGCSTGSEANMANGAGRRRSSAPTRWRLTDADLGLTGQHLPPRLRRRARWCSATLTDRLGRKRLFSVTLVALPLAPPPPRRSPGSFASFALFRALTGAGIGGRVRRHQLRGRRARSRAACAASVGARSSTPRTGSARRSAR